MTFEGTHATLNGQKLIITLFAYTLYINIGNRFVSLLRIDIRQVKLYKIEFCLAIS